MAKITIITRILAFMLGCAQLQNLVPFPCGSLNTAIKPSRFI